MSQFKTIALSAFALPALACALIAAAAVDPPKESCSNIRWSDAFLKMYPLAPAACREVTVKDGVKFAKFNGKVSKVDPKFVEVDISNVANTPINTIAFQTGVGGRITIGDKVEKVKDLKVGDVLTFWVRENQFGISPTLIDQPMPVIKPEAMATT